MQPIASGSVRCYFIEATDRARRKLRRFVFSDKTHAKCPVGYGYHDASVPLDEIDRPFLGLRTVGNVRESDWPRDDPRWPVACACGYVFQGGDEWQVFTEQIYRCPETGLKTTLRDASAGAMWYADWMISEGRSWYCGPDGHCLNVRLPGGHDWCVDSRCSNCTLPDDDDHKCWVRHGVPPLVTVGKEGGKTCQAGAGSIITPKGWHGFLRNGVLEPC